MEGYLSIPLNGFGEEEVMTAPIPLIKMVRELHKRGIVVEKVEL